MRWSIAGASHGDRLGTAQVHDDIAVLVLFFICPSMILIRWDDVFHERG